MRLELGYGAIADAYFRLREPASGNARLDELRGRVAAAYADLPPMSSILLDPAVAGHRDGPEALLGVVDALPESLRGIPVRRVIAELASCLASSPPPPDDRRLIVESALSAIDQPALEAALDWIAETLRLPSTQAVLRVDVVADGVPLGGVTGTDIDDAPVSFVAVRPHPGSTLSEAILHEATHSIDYLAGLSQDSLLEDLRRENPDGTQLWHVPIFMTAGEAVRRFVDDAHVDYGVTHGYYAKVPKEVAYIRDSRLLPFGQ